jgi:hypothetical protein
MHVAAIHDTGSPIIGQRDLELDGITGLQEISHRGGGHGMALRRRPAAPPGNRGRTPLCRLLSAYRST